MPIPAPTNTSYSKADTFLDGLIGMVYLAIASIQLTPGVKNAIIGAEMPL